MAGNIRTDYHMHTTFSPDAEDPPATMCRHAFALGMTEIALTEHLEWHPHGRWLFPGIDDYFHEIDRCRADVEPQGLMVYTGIELGNPHDYLAEATAVLAAHPFDIVIGSIHWLGEENIHETRCFAGRDVYEVYSEYFVEMARMAESVDIDVVAHFDRIFWPGVEVGGSLDIRRLEAVICDTMDTLVRENVALEVNTHFLTHQPGWNDAIATVLKWYREAGGKHVLVNSDAHRSREIGRHRAVAEELLLCAGFKSAATLPTVKQTRGNRTAAGAQHDRGIIGKEEVIDI